MRGAHRALFVVFACAAVAPRSGAEDDPRAVASTVRAHLTAQRSLSVDAEVFRGLRPLGTRTFRADVSDGMWKVAERFEAAMDETSWDVALDGRLRPDLSLVRLELESRFLEQGPRKTVIEESAKGYLVKEFLRGSERVSVEIEHLHGASGTLVSVLLFLRECPEDARVYEFDMWNMNDGKFLPTRISVLGKREVDLGVRMQSGLVATVHQPGVPAVEIVVEVPTRLFAAMSEEGSKSRTFRAGLFPKYSLGDGAPSHVSVVNALAALIVQAASSQPNLDGLVDFDAFSRGQAAVNGIPSSLELAKKKANADLMIVFNGRRAAAPEVTLRPMLMRQLEAADVSRLDDGTLQFDLKAPGSLQGLRVVLKAAAGRWLVTGWGRSR